MKTLSPEEKEDMLINKKGAMNGIIGDTISWSVLFVLLVGSILYAFFDQLF